MSDEIIMENIPFERRLHTRHRAKTQVFIKHGNEARVGCNAVNLSSGGVAIKTEGLGLRVGSDVELAFVINLGAVSKIHRRSATVKYVRNGITGFHMNPYQGK